KNGKSQKVLIGDATPTGGGAYAAVQGDPRVFTIASYTKGNLEKTANDLRDKRLLTVQADKISRLELVLNPNREDLEFGRNQDEWQILKPKPLRADSTQVTELINKLADARMDLSGSGDDRTFVSAFASAQPIATAKLTDASATQELQVRKKKDDY